MDTQNLVDNFGDWANVTGMGISFDTDPKGPSGSTFDGTLYANETHQAAIHIKLRLADANGLALTADNQPSVQAVLDSVTIIDYFTGKPVSEYLTTTQANNGYAVQYPSAKPADIVVASVAGSIATITVYLTHRIITESTLQHTIGFSVQCGPTGRLVRNAVDGDWNHPVSISILQAPEMDDVSVSVSGNAVPHSGENDTAPTNPTGQETDANLWRRFDYKVVLMRHGAPLTGQMRISNSDQYANSDYSFGERCCGPYSYKGYCWPINISGTDNEPLVPAQSSYTYNLTSEMFVNETITITPSDKALYLTLFCSFGDRVTGRFARTPLLVSMSLDPYGNGVRLSLDPDKLPDSYDPSNLKNLNLTEKSAIDLTPTIVDEGLFNFRVVDGQGRYLQYSNTWPYYFGNAKYVAGPAKPDSSDHIFSTKMALKGGVPMLAVQNPSLFMAAKTQYQPVIADTLSSGDAQAWHLKPIWNGSKVMLFAKALAAFASTKGTNPLEDVIAAPYSAGYTANATWKIEMDRTLAVVDGDTQGDWARIGNFTFEFEGTSGPNPVGTPVYANGLNQAILHLQLTLENENQELLDGSDGKVLPSIGFVKKAVTLIDFYTGTPIRQGDSAGWDFSFTRNEFASGQSTSSAQVSSDADETNTNYIKNGVAFLTLYVTCNSSVTLGNLSLGFLVTLTGVTSGQQYTIANAASTVTWLGEPPNILLDDGQSCSISLRSVPTMGTDLLKITPTHVGHADEDDDKANNSAGNLWRQWNYAIGARSGSAQIRYCVISADTTLPANNQIYRYANGFYSCAAYLWPRNLMTADNGQPCPGANDDSYKVTNSVINQSVVIPKADGEVYFSLIYYFGEYSDGTLLKSGIDITFYDIYGNNGEAHIDLESIPKQYDVDKLNAFVPVQDGKNAGANVSAKNKSTEYYLTIPSSNPGVNETYYFGWFPWGKKNYCAGAITSSGKSAVTNFSMANKTSGNATSISMNIVTHDHSTGLSTFPHELNNHEVLTDYGSLATFYIQPIWSTGNVIIHQSDSSDAVVSIDSGPDENNKTDIKDHSDKNFVILSTYAKGDPKQLWTVVPV